MFLHAHLAARAPVIPEGAPQPPATFRSLWRDWRAMRRARPEAEGADAGVDPEQGDALAARCA